MTLRRSVLRQALGAAVRAVAPHAGFGVTQQHARQCGCGDRLRTATAPLGNAACGSQAVPRERAGSHGDSGAAEGSLFPPWFSSKAPGEVTLQTIPYSYLGLRATEWSRGSRAGQWHRGPCQRRDLAVPATESPGGGGGRCSNVCLGWRVAEKQPRPGKLSKFTVQVRVHHRKTTRNGVERQGWNIAAPELEAAETGERGHGRLTGRRQSSRRVKPSRDPGKRRAARPAGLRALLSSSRRTCSRPPPTPLGGRSAGAARGAVS